MTAATANLFGHGRFSALPGGNLLTFFPLTGHYNAVADPAISGVLNIPQIQPVSALVTFTPRLAKGQLLYVRDYLVTPGYNCEQTVNIIGTPTGGTFTLQYGVDITTALAWNATPTAVTNALGALASIGVGNVNVVAGVEPFSYDVEFIGALGVQPIPRLVGNASLLTNAQGTGFCEITVTMSTIGTAQVVADAAIALPPLQARIWNGVLSTIDRADTPGFELTANTSILNLGGDLIYDVTFDSITFNQASQYFAPFAFKAPTDATPVCLTSPLLDRLPYQTPNTTIWTPPATPLMLVMPGGGWRTRTA